MRESLHVFVLVSSLDMLFIIPVRTNSTRKDALMAAVCHIFGTWNLIGCL